MVHLVNFFLYFGLENPMLLLRSCCHSTNVPKRKRYSKKWDVVFGTTLGAFRYSVSNNHEA